MHFACYSRFGKNNEIKYELCHYDEIFHQRIQRGRLELRMVSPSKPSSLSNLHDYIYDLPNNDIDILCSSGISGKVYLNLFKSVKDKNNTTIFRTGQLFNYIQMGFLMNLTIYFIMFVDGKYKEKLKLTSMINGTGPSGTSPINPNQDEQGTTLCEVRGYLFQYFFLVFHILDKGWGSFHFISGILLLDKCDILQCLVQV